MNKSSKLIPIAEPSLGGNEKKYLLDAFQSGWVSSIGKYITKFEKLFAEYCGMSYGVSTNSGTSALHLALMALGIGKGDEVIVPNFTFAACVNTVFHSGATPVLVDSMKHHWNIDPNEIYKAITPKTKAIMPVHLLGHPCLMEDIREIAKEHSCYIIEDCAEAHGASINGKRVGSMGDISCFSFYGNKIITTGEGGMCLTNNKKFYDCMLVLRDHGMSKSRRYWQESVGYNYRLTNLNAAIGLAQFERIEYLLDKRKSLRMVYDEELTGIRGINTKYTKHGNCVDWLYPIFMDENSIGLNRDAFMLKLKEANIDVRVSFYPIDMMPIYKNCLKVGELSNSKKFGLSGLLLPLYPSLSEESVRYIGKTLREICN